MELEPCSPSTIARLDKLLDKIYQDQPNNWRAVHILEQLKTGTDVAALSALAVFEAPRPAAKRRETVVMRRAPVAKRGGGPIVVSVSLNDREFM